MQPDQQALPTIRRIAAKEVTLFFASPIAYLFLATFAAVTLFIFFWGESFFARNIADVRPMFEWMPVLLIFLASTLTMRLWSEERRTGTLEYVLTQPVPLWHFVVGKFAGCLLLLLIALIITLPLPITVSVIGDLDWGPVWAGYLATFLLGAAYLSIGLFVSARSDNQIVSLITATAVSGFFYVLGSNTITDFFGNDAGEWLRLLGTGSRFDSITRGVIDLRDLYYYVSIIAVFLTLNTFMLERERWASQKRNPQHKLWSTVTVLLLINALGANFWLGQINALRLDTTAGKQYSISSATQNYLNQLQEPLLIRGYFSSKTHPLLAPLVPQLRDLLKEYEVAGHGNVKVEFVDPATNPEEEKEANEQYGIQPVPFQVADRYQSAIVSSYFNVLVQYGNEHEVLGFRDLIEVSARSEADLDVQLRNPEHDITSAIKKVMQSYQAGGNLFDTVKDPIKFTAYISADSSLPNELLDFRKVVTQSITDMAKKSNGRLSIDFVNPDANGGAVGQQIAEQYGFKPMTTNLLSNDRFYFYLTLAQGDQVVQIPLGDMKKEGFQRDLESGIKRFASGFTKTVALVTPSGGANPYNPYGGASGPQFNQLQQFLGSDLKVEKEDLSDGSVSGQADILFLAAPKELDDTQLFAVDQFLMKGGTVILATSPYEADFGNRSMTLQKHKSGLENWLKHNGLSIDDQVVLDPQNSAFPIPVTRNVSGFQLQEIRMMDYPYFIDIRPDGMNSNNPIVSDLPQVTMNWASPITVSKDNQGDRKITELLHSSAESWLSSSTDILPKVTAQGVSGFSPEGNTGSHLLGVISSGRFESYFAGQDSPLLTKADSAQDKQDSGKTDTEDKQPTITSVIDHSPQSARIILFSSNDFLRDQVIQLADSANRTKYLNTLQLAANTVDWSVEDAGLLSIRSRSHFNRTLPPMEHNNQLFWEYLNYALAALALVVIAVVQKQRKKSRERRYLHLLAQ
ncbi:Gldg family protein [Gynuella sunshinyii]|uniref:ABC-type transport system involved in multi-copper enzyme maturation, permease component n=1 Tax=Gynuella sunshinyii YC6258 TaxID=1445510 RepID=A0A0C5VSV4_9GAMM|nr:Gldg family protein [Gynuella sunshinyii]AJQ97261.1 ABC-type transport system involved in multi-copper enzyme maturation, permease component [Gynuella sunshinyii YC6258]